MQAAFPKLRHLELCCCDMLSSYEALVPLLVAHPCLLSLKASFHPRAAAGSAFAAAVPQTLMALGFISFDSPEVFAAVLEKAPLEHCWLSATATFSSEMAAVLLAKAHRLQTLCLPTSTPANQIFGVASSCPNLQLLCCMTSLFPQFETAASAAGFEPLEDSAVVMRRRGSRAQLTEAGSLWAPCSWARPTGAGANPMLGEAAEVAVPACRPGTPRRGSSVLAIEASTVARADAHALARAAARLAAARHA